MSQPFLRSTDPGVEASAQIAALRRAVIDLQNRPFRIPVLDADPSTDDPVNIWMFSDGRIRARYRNTANTAWVIREWVSTAPGSSTSATAKPALAAAPQTQQKRYAATWSMPYVGAGSQRTDSVTSLFYGNASDGYGRQRSLVGFDYTTAGTDLASSTIKAVWLELQTLGAGDSARGSDVYLGIHNFTAVQATWAGGGIPRSMIYRVHLGAAEKVLVQLPLEFATALRDGWGKGIALEVPSDSLEFYGYAAGVGSGYDLPTLVVEYAK
jgi:hypothetical protein